MSYGARNRKRLIASAAGAILTLRPRADTVRRMDTDEIKRRFEDKFARAAAGLVRAPGRVNLIGEHTDYNDGFVLPIAIERETVAAYAPRNDRTVVVASLQQDGLDATIDLDSPIEPGEPKWANYPKGVTAGLVARGETLVGCDILFNSTVPIGGGLSSSASLELATAKALLAAAGATVDDYELALICQKA